MSREMTRQQLKLVAKEKAELTKNKFSMFLEGTRVLLMLLREKDGGSNNEFKRRTFTSVIHNEEDFQKEFERMVYFALCSDEPYRIYLTVNSRNISRAERNLKQKMLDIDYASTENKTDFYSKLEYRWHSSLMQDSARETKYFLLDIDNDEFNWSKVEEKCWEVGIEIVFKTSTKNGWHFITKPFNPELLGEYKSVVKKDAQTLLYW